MTARTASQIGATRVRIHSHLMRYPWLTVNEIGRALRITNSSGTVNSRQIQEHLRRMQRDGEATCRQNKRPGRGKPVSEWAAS